MGIGTSNDTIGIRLGLGDVLSTIVLPWVLISLAAGAFFILMEFAGPMRVLGSKFLVETGVAIPGILAISFITIFFLATVYEVRPGADGVWFRYLLSRPFVVKWEEMVPPNYPYRWFSFSSIGFRSLPTASGVKNTGIGVSDKYGPNMPLRVSKNQALGILLHPNCPNWQISSEIWKSLGVKEPPSARVVPS